MEVPNVIGTWWIYLMFQEIRESIRRERDLVIGRGVKCLRYLVGIAGIMLFDDPGNIDAI